jgi:hypothetical protein
MDLVRLVDQHRGEQKEQLLEVAANKQKEAITEWMLTDVQSSFLPWAL